MVERDAKLIRWAAIEPRLGEGRPGSSLELLEMLIACGLNFVDDGGEGEDDGGNEGEAAGDRDAEAGRGGRGGDDGTAAGWCELGMMGAALCVWCVWFVWWTGVKVGVAVY